MVRIGVDVGGTGIQVGIIDETYQILAKSSIPANTKITFEEQVSQIARSVLDTCRDAGISSGDVESVGVGIPGIASPSGEIIKCTNMGWYHVPFAAEFRKHINLPIHIANDADAAALGESIAGISAGTSSSVFITIGTGIGSGIIINHSIWNGYHGIGGELGHMILKLGGEPCTCGNRGCVERYCSATAIIRMAKEALKDHPESYILHLAGGNADRINARCVIDAARENDPIAVTVFNQFTENISQMIAGLINFLDPEIIVLGGGVSRAGEFLLSPIRKSYPKYVIFSDQPYPSVVLAKLGPDAGIIGASLLK